MKTCPKCSQSKSVSEFYKDKSRPDGLKVWCRECSRKHDTSNPDTRRAYQTKWRKDHPELFKQRRRKYRYGITPDQYNQLLTEQQSCCAICKHPFGDTQPHVDHCHTSGAVRGLLCGNCNRMIGLAYDNTNILVNAVAYLSR